MLTPCLKAAPLAALIAATGCVAPAAPAAHAVHGAGEWRLIAGRCPDLVEDRRDRRIIWSRADLREDWRDARTVRCPASAVAWVPARGAHAAPRHPGAVLVRHRPDGAYVVTTLDGAAADVRIVLR
ncbi:MAG: hypothetical protein ACFE0P_00075 [Oceanicaulis sp.]